MILIGACLPDLIPGTEMPRGAVRNSGPHSGVVFAKDEGASNADLPLRFAAQLVFMRLLCPRAGLGSCLTPRCK